MQGKSISARLLGGLLVVDAIMGTLATFLWVADVDVLDVQGTVVLCVILFILSMLTWVIPTLRALTTASAWQLPGAACSDPELLAADRTIEALPAWLALAHGLGHGLYFGGLLVTTRFVLPDLWSFGVPEMSAMGLQIVSCVLTPPVIVYPLASLLLQDVQTTLAAELGRRGLEQAREPAPLEKRLLFAAMSLIVGSVFWLSSATWRAQGETARQVAAVQLREAVRHDAKDIAAGARTLTEGAAILTRAELPALLATQVSDATDEDVSIIDKRNDRVLTAAAVGDERWLVAQVDIVYDQRDLWVRLGLEVLTFVFGVGVMSLAMARLITTPLERLQRSLQRVTEAGVLSNIGQIPVVRRDEIGELTNEFNRMLDVFNELASAARAVAAGDLRVQIDGPGDLQHSFRAMVARIAQLVSQIREAALEVAGATAEIHAATREQEQAAGQQSDEIREVSIAIQRLADSAGDISKAAAEVLSNAEQTRKRADEVVGEISELGRHITRVGELLELIRDVADRSDLLALNGSLEATRAGEAGRGFALVAAEMRRLAERVTGTVADVRETVAAIGTSNSATVDATKDSRELAGSTTQAARRIVEVIHVQGSETELVSSAARTIADSVASSAAAITQTRASADGLRERAQQLEQLIEQFDVG